MYLVKPWKHLANKFNLADDIFFLCILLLSLMLFPAIKTFHWKTLTYEATSDVFQVSFVLSFFFFSLRLKALRREVLRTLFLHITTA